MYASIYANRPWESRCSALANPWSHLQVRTRSEVAKILNISRQAVHQLERRALWKIRRALWPMYQDWVTERKNEHH